MYWIIFNSKRKAKKGKMSDDGSSSSDEDGGGLNFFGSDAAGLGGESSDSDSSASSEESYGGGSSKRARTDSRRESSKKGRDEGGGKGKQGKGEKEAPNALPSAADLFNDVGRGSKSATFLDAGAGIYATDEVHSFDARKAEAERKPWLSKKQTVVVRAPGQAIGDGHDYAGAGAGAPTGLAAELTAAALNASNSYGDGDRGVYAAAEATPISEMNMKNKGDKSFNSKEKRKRDSGQSGRGKSTVEEEKRTLRQNGGGRDGGYD